MLLRDLGRLGRNLTCGVYIFIIFIRIAKHCRSHIATIDGDTGEALFRFSFYVSHFATSNNGRKRDGCRIGVVGRLRFLELLISILNPT